MIQPYIFRPFTATLAEYEAIARVYNAANPDAQATAVTWQHWDKNRDPARLFVRYVAEQEGEIGGYGFSVRTDPAANKFRFAIYLLPKWESAALIDKFYNYVMSLCLEYSSTGLLCQAREDEPIKIVWLKQQGFQQTMRYPRSVLSVTDFDPTPYSALKTKIAAQGIEIVSVAELATREPNLHRKVYELEMLLNQDVPRPTAFTPTPFEQYVQAEFEDPNFFPEGWLIALDGDAYVGMANIFKSSDNLEMLENGLTGVRRDYRRRGLATLLKCQLIEVAQVLGVDRIQTYNEENNPMFQLNLQLGFVPQPADLEWEKILPYSTPSNW